jgi:alpha-L-fucosidase
MAMGVHHDNFDCWDSAYQPWNSVRVGPKVDVVGAWMTPSTSIIPM